MASFASECPWNIRLVIKCQEWLVMVHGIDEVFFLFVGGFWGSGDYIPVLVGCCPIRTNPCFGIEKARLNPTDTLKNREVRRVMTWVCLKMLCTPLYPMVLLIIIPMKNGYFIGNIPNIFRQTHMLKALNFGAFVIIMRATWAVFYQPGWLMISWGIILANINWGL